MIITCPNCHTSFSLPDEMYRPGKKARCSQCSQVFVMNENTAHDEISENSSESEHIAMSDLTSSVSPKKSKMRRIITMAAAGICILGILVGGYLVVSSLFRKDVSALDADNVPAVNASSASFKEEQELRKNKAFEEKVKGIALENVRQTVVYNSSEAPDAVKFSESKDGKIPLIVIEGYAVNNFAEPRAYITVEGRLIDASGAIIGSPVLQQCGVVLSFFQLQTLSVKELDSKLRNKVEIYLANGYVEPGEKVPFMLVFEGAPEKYYAFEVRVADVSLPAKSAGDDK